MTEILWAPWRMTYIQKPTTGKPGGDIFVDLPAEQDDTKNLILFRGQFAFVILNAFPYATGHVMVAPYRQISEIDELNDDELLEINQLVAKSIRWLRKAYNPNGFNIGVNMGCAAGAGIPVHVHWHIVPRWNGDINFMTAIGGVRVIPQALEDTFRKLREAVESDA
jgi:ATP adenylyltransferase